MKPHAMTPEDARELAYILAEYKRVMLIQARLADRRAQHEQERTPAPMLATQPEQGSFLI